MYLILSNGHSATRWVAEILSKENFSKCYHSYSLLEKNSKINDIISYHRFLNEINLKQKLIVGSIHLPFKIDKKSLEELSLLDVKIVYLVRNPIDKINSMMQFYLKKFVSDGFFTKKINPIIKNSKQGDLYVEDIFLKYRENINSNFLKYELSKNSYLITYAYDTFKFKLHKKLYNLNINETILSQKQYSKYLSKVIINLFLFVSSSCFRFDMQAKKFNQNQPIVFEEIIKSEENFLNFSKKLNNKFSLEKLNIENFSNKIGKNVKSYNNKNFWPETFQEYFFKKVKEKNLHSFYKNMKYEIN